MKQRAQDNPETVTLVCGCGFKGHASQVHYGRVRCKCGRLFWALRPRRDGPLVAFPLPGQISPTPAD